MMVDVASVDERAPIADLLRRLLRAQRRKQFSEVEGESPLEYMSTLLEALGAGMVYQRGRVSTGPRG